MRKPAYLQIGIIVAAAVAVLSASAASEPAPLKLSVVYPKEFAVVGKHVNVVLDPLSDWSAIPFFQVSVGKTTYPVVDTSSGRHALQGVLLSPGLNTIVVKGLAAGGGKGGGGERASGKGKEGSPPAAIVATSVITVFNQAGSFSRVPEGFVPKRFHAREQEAACAGCHRLEVEARDQQPAKPEDMLCYPCHRETPSGQHVHGPAAVWSCLSCHNQAIFPVKYQFTSSDPWKFTLLEVDEAVALFTIPADALFVPQSVMLRSEEGVAAGAGRDRKKDTAKDPGLTADARRKRERQDELLQPLLEHLRQHPTDKVRIEVHTDAAALRRETEKKGKGAPSPQEFTTARAKVMAQLLQEQGITGKDQLLSVGMGTTLPRQTQDAGRETRYPNNRIEIIVHSPDIPIENSAKLPVITDRKRITVDLSYKSTAGVRNLRIAGRLPGGMQYVKGTGSLGTVHSEPQVRGDEISWNLGERKADFEESLSFVVRLERGSTTPGLPELRLFFTVGQKEESRELSSSSSGGAALDVKGTCRKCHGDILAGLVKHGPADAGHCTLCHDPHGSDHASWTRKQSAALCATCHGEHLEDVHIIKGITRNLTHPTSKVRDPSRPGKRLTCVSCHSPHSAESKRLLAYGVRTTYEICGICHPKK